MKTLKELKNSVGRELGMRKGAYPKWVKSGRMTQAEADHEIECMGHIYLILASLERLKPSLDEFLKHVVIVEDK